MNEHLHKAQADKERLYKMMEGETLDHAIANALVNSIFLNLKKGVVKPWNQVTVKEHREQQETFGRE